MDVIFALSGESCSRVFHFLGGTKHDQTGDSNKIHILMHRVIVFRVRFTSTILLAKYPPY